MKSKTKNTLVILGLLSLFTTLAVNFLFKDNSVGSGKPALAKSIDTTDEDTANENVTNESIKAKPKSRAFGLVAGLMYSKSKPSIVISGSKEIVHHEGDTIHGVTIVKIYKDKVEFVKNGQRWTQKVGEAPSPQWCQ